MSKKQKVRHLLLIKGNSKIGVAEMTGGEIEIISFKGENMISYDESFWTKMINYTSFEKGQATDICLISENGDEQIPGLLTENISEEKSVWNVRTIENAVKIISPPFSADVFSVGGGMIYNHKVLFSKDEPLSLIAKYKGSEKYVSEQKTSEIISEQKGKSKGKKPTVILSEGKDRLTDEEYEKSTPMAKMFIDRNREIERRRK